MSDKQSEAFRNWYAETGHQYAELTNVDAAMQAAWEARGATDLAVVEAVRSWGAHPAVCDEIARRISGEGDK